MFPYIKAIKGDKIRNTTSKQFVKDALSGKLPNVAWVYGVSGNTERPIESVNKGQQWTADQINAIVKGGLWDKPLSL